MLLIIQEFIVTEARALADSRLTMHRIGDKSEDEYRTQIQTDLDLLGHFLEDEERIAEVAALAPEGGGKDEDSWYEDYLRRTWAGHPQYIGNSAGNSAGNGREAEH